MSFAEPAFGQDSDVESSNSNVSGSEAHSGHTSLCSNVDEGWLSAPRVLLSEASTIVNSNSLGKYSYIFLY